MLATRLNDFERIISQISCKSYSQRFLLFGHLLRYCIRCYTTNTRCSVSQNKDS